MIASFGACFLAGLNLGQVIESPETSLCHSKLGIIAPTLSGREEGNTHNGPKVREVYRAPLSVHGTLKVS